MMNKAYSKDIWRTVRREKKRFGSLLLITALGVTMLSGLRAACSDLRHTADAFYDGQNLYDISIVSTMGLTAEDVEALQSMGEIEQAEGVYSEVVQVTLENADGQDSQVHQNKTAQVKTLSSGNLNLPYIIEGCLPEKVDEIAVTENYLTQSGKKIGDTLVINEELEEDEEPNFLQTEYKITGSIVDPMDVDSHEGVMSFRSTTAAEYTFYVMPGAVESDVYTTIYLTVKNAKDELCYSDAYKELIEKQITAIDTGVKDKRQQVRYDKLTGDASKELVDAEAEADAEFDKAQQDINEAKVKLSESRQQLEAAAAFLPSEELAVKQSALEEAQKELQENEQKLAEEMAKAQLQFDDARADIEAIEMPQWYIQDRSALSGYMNVQSDADCIEAVGTAFPILFLVVAILISLTTITRMVEEERGLIGTYKALGFTDREIRRKYLLYAAIACIFGGILGDICGFVVLPAIIFRIFGIMYQLPWYLYGFDMLYGLGGIALFAAGIIGATWISCEAELKHTPASLMRPKAPKSGARIFLERWKCVWGRLSFLNKVTARNLFRYKKRMLMTIGGIMGCTALVLCGFVIKDSVTALCGNQYGHIYRYDMLAATTDSAYDDFLNKIEEMTQVSDYISLRIETVKVKNQGEELSIPMYVIPDETDYTDYICLEDPQGEKASLASKGITITQNAANVLHFDEGDVVQLQNLKLVQEDVEVVGTVRNYMGNTVYITQTAYEDIFGEYVPNGVLMHISEDCRDQAAFADELEEIDGVQSTMSVAEMKDNFSVSVLIINVVVYIIIIMAAGLALVVLFTLATTNISERERELATIKVLGFYDAEVHLYVNKETLILTGIGILLGLPLGSVLGSALTRVLNLPSIYFAVTIRPVSYVYAAVLSFGFALLVDCLTDRTLNRIDPVEALKSVE